jgi:DAACS family dicarboxylate/amino acid:cation (Na+ or H+) symporter
MCRTTLNVVGDLTAATYVARSEGFPLLGRPFFREATMKP